jgi:hypothetical protein
VKAGATRSQLTLALSWSGPARARRTRRGRRISRAAPRVRRGYDGLALEARGFALEALVAAAAGGPPKLPCEQVPPSGNSRIGIYYYRHADQVRQASRLQLLDNVGAMQLNGAKAYAETAGDDLVGLARGHQIEDFTFPGS